MVQRSPKDLLLKEGGWYTSLFTAGILEGGKKGGDENDDDENENDDDYDDYGGAAMTRRTAPTAARGRR